MWPDSCLDLFAAVLRVRAYPVVRGLWASSLGTEGRVIAKRGGESGEWRGGEAEGGVRLITSLQANLYFELIFALPTWREGKKGEIQLRRRDWERQNLES